MSSKPNPKVIGAFVLGGIALFAGGLVALGGDRWFKERQTLVAYFPGSIKGLRVGAPVTFRGVPVGQVNEVSVLVEAETLEARLPVVFEVDPARIVDVGAEPRHVGDDGFRRDLIGRGFRAQLETESFVTGLLAINLDFFPDAPPPVYRNEGAFALPHSEVPTMASDIEQLASNAGEIALQVSQALDSINQVLIEVVAAAGDNRGHIASIVASIDEFARAVNDARPRLGELIDETTGTLNAARRTLVTLDSVVGDNAALLPELTAELQRGLVALRRMSDQVNMSIAENRQGLRDFSDTGLYEFTGLAQDAQRLVDQLSRVAEELERNPARFLFGDRSRGIVAE
jgi:paraquat-inducible protein B